MLVSHSASHSGEGIVSYGHELKFAWQPLRHCLHWVIWQKWHNKDSDADCHRPLDDEAIEGCQQVARSRTF